MYIFFKTIIALLFKYKFQNILLLFFIYLKDNSERYTKQLIFYNRKANFIQVIFKYD